MTPGRPLGVPGGLTEGRRCWQGPFGTDERRPLSQLLGAPTKATQPQHDSFSLLTAAEGWATSPPQHRQPRALLRWRGKQQEEERSPGRAPPARGQRPAPPSLGFLWCDHQTGASWEPRLKQPSLTAPLTFSLRLCSPLAPTGSALGPGRALPVCPRLGQVPRLRPGQGPRGGRAGAGRD